MYKPMETEWDCVGLTQVVSMEVESVSMIVYDM